jgi:hypothetical protein
MVDSLLKVLVASCLGAWAIKASAGVVSPWLLGLPPERQIVYATIVITVPVLVLAVLISLRR